AISEQPGIIHPVRVAPWLFLAQGTEPGDIAVVLGSVSVLPWNAAMAKPSQGSLIFFGIAIAVTMATSAGAETRRLSDNAGSRAAVRKGSAYRPSAVALAVPRPTRPSSPCEDDAYTREIAEGSARC